MLLVLESIVTFCVKNAKALIIIGAVLTVVLTVTHYLNKKEDNVQQTQQTLVDQQKKLTQAECDAAVEQNNARVAKDTADANAKAIEKLKAENDANAAARHSLGIQLAKAKDFNTQLTDKINAMSKDKDGPVADVLRTTVDEIQKDRQERAQ